MRKLYVCKGRLYGDQIICSECGLNWDRDDEDPPECKYLPLQSNIERNLPWTTSKSP